MKNGNSAVAVVAGGAGFIGSHLCDALLGRGWHVVAMDNFQTGRMENVSHLRNHPRFELLRADVVHPLPPQLTNRSDVRVVYNLACAASPPHYQANPEHTLLTNVLGTRHLLKLAETRRARFVLASTSEVYGDPEVHPQTEGYWGNVNPTGPRACYDEGKRAAETLAFDYARAGRADVRVARIFNTYGPRMDAEDGRVVSNVVTQALAGAPITIYGDGSQTRSFCFVDDLVQGLLRLAEHEGPQPGPVNLGNPIELEVNDLVARVLRMTKSASRVVNMPLPVDDPKRRRPDIERAAAVLGWSPSVPLEDGLRRTIDYFAAELRAKRAKALSLSKERGGAAVRTSRAAAAQP